MLKGNFRTKISIDVDPERNNLYLVHVHQRTSLLNLVWTAFFGGGAASLKYVAPHSQITASATVLSSDSVNWYTKQSILWT